MKEVSAVREIHANQITELIEKLFLQANYEIGADVMQALKNGIKHEASPMGKNILAQIYKNDIIAKRDKIAICQDTGMPVIFTEYGQEVTIVGGNFEEAVNNGVRKAYLNGYLRKSVVAEPLFHRTNTGDNTPAIIHTKIVNGDNIKFEVTPKGFGSENMSAVHMFAPSAGIDGVKQFVIDTVSNAGPNTCPPSVVGVGIGGTLEKACLMAKHAIMRGCDSPNPVPQYAAFERELLEEINRLGIGPAGFGGTVTSLAVNVEYYPTHIASIPVAVNLCCHAARHAEGVL